MLYSFCRIAELLLIAYCLPCRIADLEAALVDSCDFASLKSIARSRPVPNHLRAKIWQVGLVMKFHIVTEV